MDVKLYRIEQYQTMWNYFSADPNLLDPRSELAVNYNALMETPKGHQLKENLELFWAQKVAQGVHQLTQQHSYEWVGKYEIDRPRRNAELGYNSSDDEDWSGDEDVSESESSYAPRGCCG